MTIHSTLSHPSTFWLPHLSLIFAATALLVSCGGSDDPAATPAGPGAPAPAPGPATIATITSGLNHPWALAFLPDGSMLVTERSGSMRRVAADGTKSAPLSGVPPVYANGQGGLLDLALDPDFATSNMVFWSYAEPGSGADAGKAGTAVARGKLVGNALQEVDVVFRQTPKVADGLHFGARLAFAPDKTLFITLGERGQDSTTSPTTDNAQNPANTLGKVVRIQRDGSTPPSGNATTFGSSALAALYSIGHRNPQAAAIKPDTGELWIVEHGPQGGDEVNRVSVGSNYGWPMRSYGCPYGSSPAGETCRIGGGTHEPIYVEPLTYWVPTSIAPSGMAFYSGDKFPQWQGNLFVGALAGTSLWRLTLNGDTVSEREELFKSEGERIRDVRQGPDGWIYLLTDSDDGRILRIQH